MKALAYVCDVIYAGGVKSDCRRQKDLLQQFAANNEIEIVEWFADAPGGELLKKPGIGALLDYRGMHEAVVCESVWVFGGSIRAFVPLLKKLRDRNVSLEMAISRWDVVSQQCRRSLIRVPYLPSYVRIPGYQVKKPAHMHFVYLVDAL